MWFEYFTSSVLNRLLPQPRARTPVGLLLGRHVDPPYATVVFPDRYRTQHLVMVGKTGFGKTHALEGVFGEGLGGYVVFYMRLRGGRARSIICENSPAILTEGAFHAALGFGGGAAKRRRAIVPFARLLARVAPRLKLQIRLHLDFTELVDASEEIRHLEQTIVEAYLKGPDFDLWPCSAGTTCRLQQSGISPRRISSA